MGKALNLVGSGISFVTSKQWCSAARLVNALLPLVLFGCVTVEETHRSRLAPLPDSYMDKLGVQAYAEAKAQSPVATDARLTAEVLTIGRQVAAATGKDYSWEFTLFESQEVNAWCLPGGKVGVYTGILAVAKTNAGLAAVLGHEIAHAIAKHSGERMSEQLLINGALLTIDQALAESNKRPYVMAALGLGAKFGVALPFSRVQESEADHLGILYMARAGYDPRAAIDLWQRMSQAGGEPPEILSDHPASAHRREAMEAMLPEALGIWEKSRKIPTQNL